MKNQKSLQPPAKRCDNPSAMESAIEESMQKWLDNAQKSTDARDRIAVAGGISRGVFGSLHLGKKCMSDAVESEYEGESHPLEDGYTEYKQAA